MRSKAIRNTLAQSMKKLLSEELIEERMLEQHREDIEGGFQLMADKPKFCRVAARSYISLAGVWGLRQTQAAHFLSIDEDEYRRWIDEDYDRLAPDHLEKISCLLGIYRYLMALYSGHQDRVERWLNQDNDGCVYGGKPPFQLLDGADVSVFYKVRRDLAGATI